jgi:hypothetical protein
MKTLIIHPQDNSTGFLNIVYSNVEDKTVIEGGKTKKEVLKLMEDHERIMMMGHGSPQGLFGVGQFTDSRGYIIDEEMVELLSERDNSVFIWCNADMFVNRYQLKGFYSGMFISEVGEANYCGLPGTSQDMVDESNYGFCNIIGKHINEDTKTIHENVTSEYGLIAETNSVALYNTLRLYMR